jgi:hypothetical protein
MFTVATSQNAYTMVVNTKVYKELRVGEAAEQLSLGSVLQKQTQLHGEKCCSPPLSWVL